MKRLCNLAMFSIFGFTGCVVETASREEAISMSASKAPVVVPAALNLDATKSTSGANLQTECFQTWVCTVCRRTPPILRRDVLWEECTDGSRRIVFQTECGERDCN